MVNKGRKIVTKVPRCPSCRQQNYSLTVICEEATDSDVIDGVISGMGTAAMPQPVRAYGDCKNCGRKWQIRNARTAQLWNE